MCWQSHLIYRLPDGTCRPRRARGFTGRDYAARAESVPSKCNDKWVDGLISGPVIWLKMRSTTNVRSARP